jgi:hypothetical protein
MGKRKGKKRRRDFQLAGSGGISAHQAQARAGGRACGPVGPAVRSDGGGRRRGMGPHAREREGLTALTARREGGSTGVRPAASSAAVLHRGSGSSAGKRW